MKAKALKSIVITGGSSGIGAALARRLAGTECALALVGRDATRLDAVAGECRARGAACRTAALDVQDSAAIAAFLGDAPVDLLILNAGILDGRHADQAVEDGETARRVLQTNLIAAIDILHLVLPGMRARRRGEIILVASLAALVPLTDAPAYSASKAGLLFYGLALREAVAAEGIKVVVACPGYVATGMADIHIGARPGEIAADDAAARILEGLHRNRATIGFPLVPFWLTRFSLLMPESVRRLFAHGTRFHVG